MNEESARQSRLQFALKCTAAQIGYSSASNIVGTLIGHPVDTVKVRMQTTPKATILGTVR